MKHNDPFLYKGYFSGEHHSHSVAGDFKKLERISREHARYVVLLLVGFDGKNAEIARDMASLVERDQLTS